MSDPNRRTHTLAAAATAVDWDIAEGDSFDIEMITLTLASGPTTGEALTVTLDSHLGAGYDETLLTIPAKDMVGKTSVVIKDIYGLVAGDVVTVAYTNTDAISITGTATTQLVTRDVLGAANIDGQMDYYLDGVRQVTAQLVGYSEMPLVTKAFTFSATSGAQTIFTVTGDVMVKVLAVCKTNVASAGGCNVEVGITGATSGMIATTDATLLAAGEIWHDATPDSKLEASSVWKEFTVTTGADILLTPSAQLDSGALTFYCYWRPLSSDGSVVAA